MAIVKKALTVDEVISEITAKKKVDKDGVEKWAYNRFNKRKFNSLLKAMLNDPGLKAVTVKLKDGGVESVEELEVTKDFREFLKKVLVKAGIDTNDAEAVMSKDFEIESVDGLYEFFATAMYMYMNSGNMFDLISNESFEASIGIKDVAESVKVGDSKNPMTGEFLGTFENTKKAHKELFAKSSCPAWLASRRRMK